MWLNAKLLGLLALGLLGGPIAAEAGTLYGIDDATRTLFSIDTNTLVETPIGSTGVSSGSFGDLAYDAASGTMYWAAGRDNDNLYRLNLSTGAATLIGNYGINDLFALAWTGTALYGQSPNGVTNGTVYTINTNTAAATFIGTNTVYPGGLAWNSRTSQLVLLQAGGVSSSFYKINLTNGSATILNGGAGFVDDNDIAYDSVLNTYWAADYRGRLFRYDATTFARTTILTGIGSVEALEFVAVPEPSSLVLSGICLLGTIVSACRRRMSIACAVG